MVPYAAEHAEDAASPTFSACRYVDLSGREIQFFQAPAVFDLAAAPADQTEAGDTNGESLGMPENSRISTVLYGFSLPQEGQRKLKT